MHWDRRLFAQFDWILLIALLGLIGVGFVVIASAAHTFPDGERPFLIKQSLAVVVGFISWFVLMGFDYRDFSKWSKEIYVITIIMLVAVLVMGDTELGAQRWITLGPIHFQPSEPAKLLLTISLARYLSMQRETSGWWELIITGLLVAVPMGLILLQPDLGTALALVAISFPMLYMAGMSGWRLVTVLVGGIGSVSFWVYSSLQWGVWIPLKDYQVMRLIVFLNPNLDPIGSGYHVIQSKIAIGSGNLFGKGWYAGTQNQLGFLPEAHTDFIFAVLCEEFGFFGGAVVLGLAAVVLTRLLISCALVEDRFGRLLLAGISGMLAFQFFENVGMTMGVMPVTGIPLPFVSYGPSAMLTNLAAVGIAVGVVMRRKSLMF